MKKASTWYLLALAILNVLLALGTSAAAAMWAGAYRKLGILLPKVTLVALSLHWWPYVFVGVAVFLAMVSVGSKWPSGVFLQFLVILLIGEGFILFMAQIVFVLPLVSTLTFQ